MAQLPISMREQLPWVILRLGKHRLGLSALWVREMTALGQVVAAPGSGPHLRGMIDLRGETLPLLDMRHLLGLPSLGQQLDQIEATLREHEELHRAWLNQLEEAAAMGQARDLPLDPEQCPFGRWYSRLTTDEPVLISQLAALDSPHRQAHEMAREVMNLLQAGQTRAARQSLESHRGTALYALPRQIKEARQALGHSRREIAVVVDFPERASLALAVDEVEAVEELISSAASLDETDSGALNHRLLAGVGQRIPSGEIVFLLNLDHLGPEVHRPGGQSR